MFCHEEIRHRTAINWEQKKLAIANITGAIKRINGLKYVVKSSGDVNSTDSGWVWLCPDHTCRGIKWSKYAERC
jgi:hypothetical protein